MKKKEIQRDQICGGSFGDCLLFVSVVFCHQGRHDTGKADAQSRRGGVQAHGGHL